MFPDPSGKGYLPDWLRSLAEEEEPEPEVEEVVDVSTVEAPTEPPVLEVEPEPERVTPVDERRDVPQRQLEPSGPAPEVVPDKLDEDPELAEPFERTPAEKRSLVLVATLACFAAFMILRGTVPVLWGPVALWMTWKTVQKLRAVRSFRVRLGLGVDDG